MQLFVIFIGAVTGFCFANTFEIIIFYKYQYSYYSEYIISMAIAIIVGWTFHYNVFNSMLSFIGSFFIIRGIVMLVYNNQIAEMKQFLYFHGLGEFDTWMPIF
jgi:hypothetical protein